MKQPYTFHESNRLFAEAQTLITGGSQGTRTPLGTEFPSYFTRCKGCRMWDVDGNEFIDLLCSIGPITLGYAYDRVDDAARAIMAESFQSSMNHPIQLELARLIQQMVPSAERMRFLKTGTDATCAAARLARYITKRQYIARHGYHGWADMWLYGLDNGVCKEAWSYIPPFDGTAQGLEDLFKKTKQPFAAVILCPADTRPFTTENFQGIIDVAHRHGALVIFDEIKTGFRTALGGAQELLGVMPDFTTLSKGIANGYPLSLIAGKKEYMEKITETSTAGTFSVEALAIAAAVATLKEFKEKNVVAHLWKVGQRLLDGLTEICQRYGIEKVKAYPDPVPSMPRLSWKPGAPTIVDDPVHQYFFAECIRYGLFFCSWHVAFVNFSHQNRDIDEALDICDFVMAKTKKHFASSPANSTASAVKNTKFSKPTSV